MPFKFNPFTSTFDLTGSSGGGGSYINGTVATPAYLPVTVGTPALDSVYLAKAASGVYFISRKPAGLYCRTANSGALTDWTYLGAFPEINSDANWRLFNDTTTSKQLAFDLSGISEATTHTLTVPDYSGTIALSIDPPAAHAATHQANGSDEITSLRLAALLVEGPNSSPDIKLKGKTFFGNYAGSAGLLCESTSTFGDPTETFGFTGVNEAVSAYKAIGFTANGSPQFFLKNNGNVGVGTLTPIAKLDVTGSVVLRDLSNPQSLSVYSTTTEDNEDWERLVLLAQSANAFVIDTQAAGSGVVRGLIIRTGETARMTFGSSGTVTLNTKLALDAQNVSTDTTTGTKIGTATTQKLGFWNATPVAQPSSTGTAATGFTSNGPTNIVYAGSTFTGGVGTTAYNISDIVKHLKNLGLIAL